MDGDTNITPPSTPNLPQVNNNPGDLKFAGQTNATQGKAGFADFPTPQDGYAGLLNDIQAKINKNPSETLEQFSDTYAPADDGNNPAEYTTKLANQLGGNTTPMTTIGSLEPQIGKFADAIANNEGYTAGGGGGLGNAAGEAYNAVGGAPGVIATGGAAIGGLALGADALGLGEGALNAVNGFGGDALDAIGLGGLLGGSTSSAPAANSAQSTPTPDLLPPTTQAPKAAVTPPAYQTPINPTPTYNNISNLLTSTIGGQKITQEGEGRGLDVAAIIENSGALPHIEPDEDGNINKVAGVNYLNGKIAADKTEQMKDAHAFNSPTHLDDMQSASEKEVESALADTGSVGPAKTEVQRIFDDLRSVQPMKKDKNGKEFRTKSVNAYRLQKIKEKLKVNEKDFARPNHERKAATLVRKAIDKRLSQIAKQEGNTRWDGLNRRMEAHILAKNAIAKLPKKAPRNRQREFRNDIKKTITGAIAGAVVGKLFGRGITGGLIGGALEHQLQNRYGKKEYSKLGVTEDIKQAKERAKKKGLISLA